MNSRIIITVCGLLAIAGCKAHKQVLVNRPAQTQPAIVPAAATVRTTDARLSAIRGRQVYYHTFSGKAKAKLAIDGDENDVTLNVRIDHNKKIWVSVVATVIVNVEVARALITPDSIIVINKLQGVYLKKPFSYIYQYAGKQATFQSVEALLVGNAIPDYLTDNTSFTADNANTVASGNLQEVMYRMIFGADYKVSQTNLQNRAVALTLQVANSAFIQADNRVMPSQIDIISSAGSKKINASLHYINTEFDKPVDMIFNIPDRYKPVD